MCDVVLCGGVTCETQGELCDQMGIEPEGLVLLHGLGWSKQTCLCTVDIKATAKKTDSRPKDITSRWLTGL